MKEYIKKLNQSYNKTFKIPLLLFFFACIYLLAQILGNFFYFEPGSVATFWPASGILIAVLLIVPFRFWPAVIAAGLCVQGISDIFIYNRTFIAVFFFGIANITEGVVGAIILRRFFGFPFSILKIKNLLGFITIAVLFSTGISAFIGAAVIKIVYNGSYWSIWQIWWFADALGMISIAPLILSWANKTDIKYGPAFSKKTMELLILLGLSITVCLTIFDRNPETRTFIFEFPYIIFPLIIWSAFRFDIRISSIITNIVIFILIINANNNHGPFIIKGYTTNQIVLSIQTFCFSLILIQLVVNVILHARNQAESQIRHELKEKNILLNEVHHRVKNNLQLIRSIVLLESRQSDNSELKNTLKIINNRITSISSVHQLLYQNKSMHNIHTGQYIDNLIHNLIASIGDFQMEIKQDINNFQMDIVYLIPVGLIITELISNSLMHAFPDRKKGLICISIKKDNENNCSLEVKNNGIGIPKNIDRKSSIGMILITSLVDQINGKLEINNEEGTSFLITFPIKD
ncbi:MASE1 domain-containing protein [Spirochaetota bacterium]